MLIAAVTILIGNYIDTVCDTANECDVNALISKAVTIVTNAIATVCGTNQVANCDPSHLIPEVCLNRPVDVPLILPGGTQDADGDGIPGIRYTQSTVSTNGCNTQTTPGSPGTLPAPDPDDGDPNVPIPDPSSICRDIDQPLQSTTYAQATLVSDADGDGVPYIVVPIYSAGVDGDCQPVVTQTGEYHLGPDPDDTDPSNPVNPAYCDMREGFGVNLPSSASQADADGDGFPVLTITYTRYELQSDCSLQTSPGTTGTIAIDPDDGDDQNPIATDDPVCFEYTRTMWIPTGAAQEDNDGDGIPVVGLAEREYVLDSDCNLHATGNQRVNPTFMAGDPDDGDPDNPVPRQIEPCNNVDSTQLWIPYVPTSQDADGDGVPVITMRERLVSLDPDCTVTPTTQYRSGDQVGDPDDNDPDNPGVSCTGIDMPTTKVPTGASKTKDEDGDGIPQMGYVRETISLGSDCDVTFSDPETTYLAFPDTNDDDANRPVPFDEPCGDIEVPSFQIVSVGRVSDDDGDRVPLIHTESQTFGLNNDCSVSEGSTTPGPTYGDPDDNDIDNPVPTNPQVCQNLDVTTFQVYNPPTVEDKDGDQVPWLHFTYDEKSINPDCTVAPGPTKDAGGIGDPDDTNPYDPIVDPTAVCQLVEQDCSITVHQPTGQTRSSDADGDGFPVYEVEFQDYELSFDPSDPKHAPVPGTETWSTVGGDPDDADPDNPIPREVEPCGGLMLPAVPLPSGVPVSEDLDGDGVPNYKQTFEDRRITSDCTVQGTGDLQTLSFGPDPDDADPDNPAGVLFPCSGLESPFYVPSSYRIDDADGDRVPVAIVVETRYTVSSSCDITNTGQTRDSPLGPVGDPDDTDDQVPLADVDPCQGRTAPCDLGTIPVPTTCNVKDNDGDGIAQASICTTSLVLQSDGNAYWNDPIVLYGPIGDPDDADGERPIPYSVVGIFEDLLDESVGEVERILGDVMDAQRDLQRLVNQTVDEATDEAWAAYAEVVQALDYAQQHFADTADRALAFVACSTSATETHAALLQNRIDAYASNPNETTYAQFLDAAIEGGNSYLLKMRDCNEPSRILAYGVEEAQYQCAAANHVIMEGARIVRDSQDPVYDLDRIFEPSTTRTQDMLNACLDAPGRFLVELATLLEYNAESAQYALVSYADPQGSDFMDDLAQLLGPDPANAEPEADAVTRFSLPFTLALAVVAAAAFLAMRRR